MKGLIRNALIAIVAIVGSMPVQAATASSGPCDGQGGIQSASTRPAGHGFDVTAQCAGGQYEGPYTYEIR